MEDISPWSDLPNPGGLEKHSNPLVEKFLSGATMWHSSVRTLGNHVILGKTIQFETYTKL